MKGFIPLLFGISIWIPNRHARADFLDNFETNTLSQYSITPSGSSFNISAGKLNVAASSTGRTVQKISAVDFPVGATVSVDFGTRNVFEYSALSISSDAGATNYFEIGRGTYNGGSSHGLVGWSDDAGFDLSPSVIGNNRLQTDGNPMTLRIKRSSATSFTFSYVQGTSETAIYTIVDPEWSGATSVYLMLKTARDTGSSMIPFDNLSVAGPTHFTVTTIPNSTGSILGGGMYAVGITCNLTASPNPGYMFSEWSGDATGSANPLALLVNADKTVGATFVSDQNDSDGDGLSNYQEAVIYGTDYQSADTDSDGLSDGQEVNVPQFSLVSIPSVANSWLAAHDDALARGGHLATFTSQAEFDLAKDLIGPSFSTTWAWLGGSDSALEGQWTWVTGEAFGFQKWLSSEPNNATNVLPEGEDYLVMNQPGHPPETWNDCPGVDPRPGALPTAYILEKKPLGDPLDSDSDDDGWGDGAEVEFGGSPTDPTRSPKFELHLSSPSGSGSVTLRFPAALGHTYTIHASETLGGWEPLETGIPGTGQVIERVFSRSGFPKRFFKVGQTVPPP